MHSCKLGNSLLHNRGRIYFPCGLFAAVLGGLVGQKKKKKKRETHDIEKPTEQQEQLLK